VSMAEEERTDTAAATEDGADTTAASEEGAGTAATTEEGELTPERAAEMDASGEAQLVDVRTADERDAGRIAGSLHVPFDDLGTEAAAELDRSRPVIFYCRGGERSKAAAAAFRASGWDAQSIAGGLAAWVEQGQPLEPKDGQVAPRSNLPSA
jgi:rhodanese-related sulfurtransferase